MENWRLFIAADLSEEMLRWMAERRRVLESHIPSGAVRWVSMEGIHLTLKFLGDTPSGRIGDIHAVMKEAVRGDSAFPIAASGLGCFPNPNRPRVIWAGLRKSAELADLQHRLEKGLAEIGFPRESRAFSPHLTLGRVRDGLPPDTLRRIGTALTDAPPDEEIGMRVEAIHLFRSVLRPSGAEYTRLHSVPLSG
jgi:2'-5' RNA ligase